MIVRKIRVGVYGIPIDIAPIRPGADTRASAQKVIVPGNVVLGVETASDDPINPIEITGNDIGIQG